MCGRVYIAPANPELRELVKEMNRSRIAERFRNNGKEFIRAEGELFPSAVLPVIAVNKAGKKRVFPMKWGFRGRRGLLINARTETAAEKPAFKESWEKHRCIIPVSGYFEWEHDEKKRAVKKYVLYPENNGILWLAGLYHMENDMPEFVILTRPAEQCLLWMHDRMPAMLPPKAIENWILPESNPEQIIHSCLKEVCWEQAR